MKLVIDRQKWARGDDSSLLDSDGMCCLGFLAKQCGYDDEEILFRGRPETCDRDLWPKGILFNRKDGVKTISELTFNIMEVNDNYTGSAAIGKCHKSVENDSERENLLKNLFSEINIDVEFIN